MPSEYSSPTLTGESQRPDNWREATLSSIAEVRFSSVDKITHPSEEPVRLCNYIDVYDNDYITSHLEFMRASATRPEIAKYRLQVGDLIITKDSETPDDIGIPTVVDYAAPDLVCGYHLGLIRPNHDEVDSTFLAKQLSHHRIARYFGRQANGLTRYGLPMGAVNNTPLWLPEHNEQKAIGLVLRLVDEAIAKAEAVVAKLKDVRSGLLHDLLTRGLDEHGQLRDPITHPKQFQDSPLGRIPREWVCRILGDLLANGTLADIQDGNHGELHPKSDDFVDDGVPFIMAADIAAGEVNLASCKRIPEQLCAQLRIGHSKPGDVLLSHKGSVGFVAMVGERAGQIMLTPQVTYYRVARTARLVPEFLKLFMEGHYFQQSLRNLAKQSTRDYVGILMQQTIPIAFPSSLREQRKIAELLSLMTARYDTEVRLLNKLRELKSGLMSDLLTGRVRVPEEVMVAS